MEGAGGSLRAEEHPSEDRLRGVWSRPIGRAASKKDWSTLVDM